MQPNTNLSRNPPIFVETSRIKSLQSRADDVLVAIALLGLIAILIDGDADTREVRTFTNDFRERFALSKSQTRKFIALALERWRITSDTNLIDCACDTLNEHLDSSQKISLFEALTDVLIADGRIDDGEEDFFAYIVDRLSINNNDGQINLFDSLIRHQTSPDVAGKPVTRL